MTCLVQIFTAFVSSVESPRWTNEYDAFMIITQQLIDIFNLLLIMRIVMNSHRAQVVLGVLPCSVKAIQ